MNQLSDPGRSPDLIANPIARLYAQRTLDRVIDLAQAIAYDFASQEQRYPPLSEDVTETLNRLRERTGRDPQWPDRAQREALTGPVRQRLCDVTATLRRAAIEASEQDSVGIANSFREAVDELRSLCHSVETAAVAAENQVDAVFGRALTVIGYTEIARRFNLPPVSVHEGFSSVFSPELARLHDAVIPAVLRPELNGRTERFPILQRVAHHGAHAIHFALSGDEHLRAAMDSAYK